MFVAGFGAAGVAYPLTVDVHPSAKLGEIYDSNVYLLGPTESSQALIGSPHRSDFISQGVAGLQLALTQSLQKLDVEGEYGRDEYSRFRELDNDHYKFKGTASLVLTRSLTATISASKDHFLQSLANRTDESKGFQRESKGSAEVAYAITPEWSIRPEVDVLRERFSLLDQTPSDVDENASQLSLEYRRASLSAAGLKVRNVEGDYPHRDVAFGSGEETSYRQRSADAFATYIPSGLSSFNVEVGYTQRRHEDPSVPNFSGPTGMLTYRRTISGKTYLQVDAFRRLQQAYEIGVNFERESGYDALANYAVTAKTALALEYLYIEDAFVGSQAQDPLNIGRTDKANIYRVGFQYEPLRKFLIEPQFRYESHDSTRDDRAYQFSTGFIDIKYTY